MKPQEQNETQIYYLAGTMIRQLEKLKIRRELRLRIFRIAIQKDEMMGKALKQAERVVLADLKENPSDAPPVHSGNRWYFCVS